MLYTTTDKSIPQRGNDYTFTSIVQGKPFNLDNYETISEILGPNSVRVYFTDFNDTSHVLELSPRFFQTFMPYREARKFTFTIESDADKVAAIKAILEIKI